MSLLAVREFSVSSDLVDITTRALREAGEAGCELFVLWSGKPETERFVVLDAHIPRQYALRHDLGASVQVRGEELHRLNVWLYDSGQALGVQIHSHPQCAYHSHTDDAYPIVTALGGLSVVVPQFGRDGVLGLDSKGYRQSTDGWTQVDDLAELVTVRR